MEFFGISQEDWDRYKEEAVKQVCAQMNMQDVQEIPQSDEKRETAGEENSTIEDGTKLMDTGEDSSVCSPVPTQDNENEFKFPRKVAKVVTPKVAVTSTSNKFANLEQETVIEDFIEIPPYPKKPKRSIQPLMVYGITKPFEFTNNLGANDYAKFSAKMAGNFIRIHPESLKDKNLIKTYLIENNLQFYCVPDTPVPLKAVIRGLPINTPTELIKEKLACRNYDILNIIQMTRRKSSNNPKPLPLFIIHLLKNEKSSEIFNETTLFQIDIRVEKFRSSRKPIQCFKCQNFFHIAANCHINPRCVKCGEDHLTKVCPHTNSITDPTFPKKCCNCQENHTASFKGCKKFPTLPGYRMKPTKEVRSNPSAKPRPVLLPTPPSTNDSSLLADIHSTLSAIKKELAINSFDDLNNFLIDTHNKIKNTPSRTNKLLTFLSSLDSLPTC